MYKQYYDNINKFIRNLELPLHKWANSDLLLFFTDILKMSQYCNILKKKNMNGNKLIKYCHKREDLKTLGIYKIGHNIIIKKIFIEIIRKFPASHEKYLKCKKQDTSKIQLCAGTNHEFKEEIKININNLKYSLNFIDNNDITNWDTYKLHNWLIEIGLSMYADIFKKHKIAGDILFDIQECDLMDMGIKSYGNIKRIIKIIDEMCIISNIKHKDKFNKFFNIPVKKWNMRYVILWINTIGYSRYADIFKKNQINGKLLLDLVINDLRDIGIKSVTDQKNILGKINKLKKKRFKY